MLENKLDFFKKVYHDHVADVQSLSNSTTNFILKLHLFILTSIQSVWDLSEEKNSDSFPAGFPAELILISRNCLLFSAFMYGCTHKKKEKGKGRRKEMFKYERIRIESRHNFSLN